MNPHSSAVPQARGVGAGAQLFTRALLGGALRQSLLALDPRRLARNPVMFVTWIGAVVTTIEAARAAHSASSSLAFVVTVAVFLWLTVWFGTLAESVAEARGRAQADTLRASRQEVMAKRLDSPSRTAPVQRVSGLSLRRGDTVLIEAGDIVPADGEVIEGVASVDESAVTGESAPVIRESGGDRSAVTGGTRVLSDWLVVRVTVDPGDAFLDRMIAMVEGSARRKSPNEIALTILLAGLTFAFVLVCASLYPIGLSFNVRLDISTLAALLVCLIPTTIGALLSAIGIAGMARLAARNVLAMSGRAVEAAGDVDVLLLDKTGTITLGNRRATAFVPAPDVDESTLAEAAQLCSLADETPEGRSIVVLAKERHGLRGRPLASPAGPGEGPESGADSVPAPSPKPGAALPPANAHFLPFSAQHRMSGVDLGSRRLRKGAVDAVAKFIADNGGTLDPAVARTAERIASAGGTPLLVAEAGDASLHTRVLGVVHLKDIVKGGIRQRFAQLRAMGIRTVMITGDNPRTAAAIAAEAGVDEFLAEATPEDKLRLIRRHQAEGHLVAMTGDGTNDAPALAQADVAVAMQSGTQAAKEAGNMVDLDSNPTKLIDIVVVGKQMLMTRGALTTFSIANDVAKYFAIVPAIFVTALPSLAALNVMGLATPRSAILSAVIFNALVIPALIPIAMKGVRFHAVGADALLRRNLAIYGIGGLAAPFLGIKLIDLIVAGAGLC